MGGVGLDVEHADARDGPQRFRDLRDDLEASALR